jgi:hypothetical protein
MTQEQSVSPNIGRLIRLLTVEQAGLMGPILLMLAIPFIMLSCSHDTNASKTIEVRNSVAHYSLSYPRRYEQAGPYVTSRGKACSLSLLAGQSIMTIPNPNPVKTGNVNASHVPASISISVYSPVDNRNAKAQLGFILEKEGNDDPGFRLVDRSTTEVDGIPAEQATYSASGPFLFKGTPTRLIRAIYFDHNGYVWQVDYFAEGLTLQDTVAKDFDYVMSTFRILD